MKNLSNFLADKIAIILLVVATMTFATSCDDDDDNEGVNYPYTITVDSQNIHSEDAEITFKLDTELAKRDGEYDAYLFLIGFYVETSILKKYGLESLKDLIFHDDTYYAWGTKQPEKYQEVWSYVGCTGKREIIDKGILKEYVFKLDYLESNTEYSYVFFYDAHDYARWTEEDEDEVDRLEILYHDIEDGYVSGYSDKEYKEIKNKFNVIYSKAQIAEGVTDDKTFTTTK